MDGLGKQVDPGIKVAVASLRYHGLDTVASCEGHADWGRPYPWIRLQPEPPALPSGICNEREAWFQGTWVARYVRDGLRQAVVLQGLLDGFYRQRETTADAHLILARFVRSGTGFDLISAGASRLDLGPTDPAAAGEARLRYQEEMRAFARFLRVAANQELGRSSPAG